MFIGACGGGSSSENPSINDYEHVELTAYDKSNLIDAVTSVLGSQYLLGGQSVEEGFDCSGLLVWAYDKLGFEGFQVGDKVKYDANSKDMFKYNVADIAPVFDYSYLNHYSEGDWLFFENEETQKIEHVAVFSHYDSELEQVWVWDATDLTGIVSYRYIEDFLNKNPYITKPLKLKPLN